MSYIQESGSHKLHTTDLCERVTTQLNCSGGGPSANPTKTKFPSEITIKLYHIYRGQKSTELQSKGARSITITKKVQEK